MTRNLEMLDISAAPVGRIFDSRDPDNSVEERYFSNWRLPLTPHKYWKRASPFAIEDENGEKVLECTRHCDAAIITGSEDWTDYTASARIRLLSRHGRAGVMARYKTSRHYYFFALDAVGECALIRRADEDWDILARAPVKIDPRKYHELKLTADHDTFSASLDGHIVLTAKDSTYVKGPAGIRGNCRVRYSGVEISTGEKEAGQIDRRGNSRLAAEKSYQSRYPKEKLFKRLPKPDFPHEMSRLGRVGPGGEWGWILYNSRSVFSESFANIYCSGEPGILGIATLGGKSLWGREMNVRFPFPIDVNGDGCDEILCVLDNRITVLSSENGEIISQAELPESCPFQGNRGQAIAPDLYPWYAADLRGNGSRRDFVIKDDRESHGGRTLWAYNGDLKPLWTAQVGWPRYGHALSMCDINSDGRDEILAGFTCFDADGHKLWNARDTEFNDDDHVDEVKLGLFGPNGEPRACGTNGDDGFFILDGISGDVITCLKLGHVQGVSVGNYLPNLPGLEYLVGSRWGSFGILNIVDAEGKVRTTWEPDNVSQGGPLVKWAGDGSDLFLLSSSAEAFGLWNGEARRCVALDCPELPAKGFYGVQKGQGTVKDIDGDGFDELIFAFPEEVFIYKSEAAKWGK